MTSDPVSGEDLRRAEARAYVRRLRGFYIHLGIYISVMVIIIIVNVAVTVSTGNADEWWAWWFIWPLVGWGLGVAIHGLIVRASGRRGRFGADWEERKIDEVLAKRPPD